MRARALLIAAAVAVGGCKESPESVRKNAQIEVERVAQKGTLGLKAGLEGLFLKLQKRGRPGAPKRATRCHVAAMRQKLGVAADTTVELRFMHDDFMRRFSRSGEANAGLGKYVGLTHPSFREHFSDHTKAAPAKPSAATEAFVKNDLLPERYALVLWTNVDGDTILGGYVFVVDLVAGWSECQRPFLAKGKPEKLEASLHAAIAKALPKGITTKGAPKLR